MTASALAVLTASVLSFAGGSPVTLDWTAPQECPGASQVTAEVMQLLGASASRDRHIDATARVARSESGGYTVTLSTTSPEGKGYRSLDGSTCAEVADAAALILALAIDPELSPEPVPPARTSSSAAPPAPPPREAEPPPSREAPPVRVVQNRLFVGANLVLDDGVLSSSSSGLGVTAGYVEPGLRVAASFADVSSRAYAGASEVAGADLSLTAVALHAAYQLPCDSLCAYGGGGGSLTYLHGRGFGIDEPHEGSAYFAAIDAEVGATALLFEPLYAVFSVEALVPLRRQRFVLPGIGEVERPSAIAARGHLGIELRF